MAINGFFNSKNGINGFLIRKIKGHFRYFRERCFVRWKVEIQTKCKQSEQTKEQTKWAEQIVLQRGSSKSCRPILLPASESLTIILLS